MLETPVFYYDIANFAVPDDSTMCRLHFYFKVFNDKLTFIKIDSVYKARYEISLVVLQDDNQVDGDIWKDEIITDSYAKTNSSRDFQITHVSFDVEPGDYQLAITFEDLESEQVTKEKLSAHLRDFSKQSLILSDITLASRVEVDSVGLRGIQPEIANYTFAVGQPLYAYFEIYDTVLNREVKISYEVKNIKNKKIASSTFSRKMNEFRNIAFFQINTENLSYGKFRLKLKVEAGDDKSEIEKLFIVRWSGLPASISDLELAIEQLRYIADKKELKTIKKASDDKKYEEFLKFWKRRDPTPGTVANEAMDEHYRRVRYTNEFFTNVRDGWRTDRGMVYILLGPPNDLVRDPYPIDGKPYEVWYYYQLNRNFLFYDDTGFGDYRLANPETLYELEHMWR